MPDTGAPWYIPYPVAGDAPDDPTQSRIRAEQIHADLNKVKAAVADVQSGGFTGGLNNATSFTQTVTFPRLFPVGPQAFANINSGAGSTSQAGCRAISTVASGFTFYIFHTSALTFSVPLVWMATTAGNPTPMAGRAVREDAPEDWHYVTVTCHTGGCEKCDEPVADILVPDVPADWGWQGVACGVCRQPIDDIVEG